MKQVLLLCGLHRCSNRGIERLINYLKFIQLVSYVPLGEIKSILKLSDLRRV